MNNCLALVTDLGGTFIKCALVNESGKVVYSNAVSTEAQNGRDYVIKRIIEQQGKLFTGRKDLLKCVSAVAIGCPGPVDAAKGIVSNPPNLPGWENVPIGSILHEVWKLPIFVENDANAAALGEYWFGAGRGSKSMVCITLGTGVGGGIVIDGKIFHGSTGVAGEIGHITIEPDGRRCPCGNTGCLERYVGRQAIERLSGKKGSLKELGRLARSNNESACGIIKEIGWKIGIVTADIANFLNPEMIIIGGGIAGLGKPLFDAVRSETKKRAFPDAVRKLKILRAKLGENAGLIGLAKIVFNNI